MKIGVLGPGLMGDALATQWAQAGHEVMVAGRTAGKAARLAERLGPPARSGSMAEVADFADVVLMAIRHEGVLAALREAGAEREAFHGKTVIDCTNPVEVQEFTLTTGGATSMAEQIQTVAAGAHVVKAFNLCQAKVWQMRPPRFDGRLLAVPYCGDNGQANAIAHRLITDLGCIPVEIGPLHRARHLEAMAAIVIGLLFNGHDPYTVFNLIIPAGSEHTR